MKKCKQTKLFKAVAKGKCKRIHQLCNELGYGPEILEELILMAHFSGYKPQQQVSFTYNR